MILAYHRPKTLAEAIRLLSNPDARPLGGGTLLSKPTQESFEAVDLQALGLNKIKKKGNHLEIGATATLQGLFEDPLTPPALKEALKLEAPLGLRNAATVAGTLVVADGRSTFTTVLLALDAKLNVEGMSPEEPSPSAIALGEYLPLRPAHWHGLLITRIEIPLNMQLVFDSIARTPGDKPLICAALAYWNSGRTRLTLGGFGDAPLLAMDGTETDGLVPAAQNALHEAADEWGSAEYRQEVAGTLASRCLNQLAK